MFTRRDLIAKSIERVSYDLWTGTLKTGDQGFSRLLASEVVRGRPAHTARPLLDWLRTRVTAYNAELHAEIFLPPRVIRVARDPAAITPGDFARLSLFREVEANFLANPEALQSGDLPTLTGALVFAWVANGQDARVPVLDSLLANLVKLREASTGAPYVDLPLDAKGKHSRATQLAPAFVELLVRRIRFLMQGIDEPLPDAEAAWQAFLLAVGSESIKLPISRLAGIGRTIAVMNGCGLMHWTLRSPELTMPLSGAAYRRLLEHTPGVHRLGIYEPEVAEPATAENLSPGPQHELSAVGVEELLTLMRQAQKAGDSSATACHQVAKLRANAVPELEPAVDALYEFARYQLQRAPRPALPITARKHLAVVAPAWSDLVLGLRPAELQPDELRSVFDAVIDRSDGVTAVAGRLKSVAIFQSFLVKTYGIQPVALDSLDGYAATDPAIRSNFLSPLEFRHALQLIDAGASEIDPRRLAAERQLLTLAYRTGMRPAEIFGLRLGDVQGRARVDLRVRPWGIHRLKTPNARRTIPLSILLEPQELAEFMNFVQPLRDSRAAEMRLFSAEAGVPLPNREAVVKRLTKILAQATGLTSVPIYLLRHSFANTTLMRLVLAGLPELMSCLPFKWLSQSEFQPTATRRLLESLFPDLRGELRPVTQRILPAIAHLMGHLSPRTTVLHYIHLSEVLRSAYGRLNERPYPASVFSAMFDVSPSMIRKLDG